MRHRHARDCGNSGRRMPRRIELPDRTCGKCGVAFNRTRYPGGRIESTTEFHARRFCSRQCFSDFNQGVNHPLFVPGGTDRGDGYFRTSVKGRRVYVHREVLARSLGRPLLSSEHVHHEDEIKSHNTEDNLVTRTNSEHRKYHAAKQLRGRDGQFVCQNVL